MTRKRKLKCIKGLSASASSRLRKRARDELREAADAFAFIAETSPPIYWWRLPIVQAARARYNRARALAAECGV